MRVGHRLQSLPPSGIRFHHAALQWARANQTHFNHQVLKASRLHVRDERDLSDYPNIQPLFSVPVNVRATREGWEQVLRVAASVKTGQLSAARLLRKLNVYHPEIEPLKALREIGRIIKTLFLLDYLRDQALRRRVLVGLNKIEAYHALARAVHIGQGGVLKSRSIEDQANQITCLRSLITAILMWIAVYTGKAVEWLRSTK